MSQIYVSGPWSFATGVQQVVKSIKAKDKANNVVYSEKGREYQISKLEQSDYVVFVLESFAWSQKLESISKGVLTELIWCINHRIPMFLAYKSANGLGIYSAEIDDSLKFKGIAGTADNIYQIIKLGSNETPCKPLQEEQVDLIDIKQQKNYFY